MNNKVTIFLPTRKGSQRVINKNTRPFCDFNFGLLELKLNQLILVKSVDKIILSTNDEVSLDFATKMKKKWSNLEINHRPDNLALSSTNLSDLIKYVPSITKGNHILWTHVTSPFVTSVDYDIAIDLYFKSINNGFDSLMSVKLFKHFLWSNEKGDIINRCTPEKWPRSQDLMELFEIDSAIFIASRNIYEQQNDRIGTSPCLFLLDGIKSFDIDWEDDFNIAEAIYSNLITNK